MSVRVAGVVLSSLLYEHGACNHDVEGFLLGKVLNVRSDSISDSHLTSQKEEDIVCVSSYIVSGKPFLWYDNVGRIVSEKLKELLPHDLSKVIGWFKFRRNSTLSVSLRERAIHRHLTELPLFSNSHFVFCLCCTFSCAATLSLDYTFLHYNEGAFLAYPVHTVNLQETSHLDYNRTSGSAIALAPSSEYTNITKQFESQFIDKHGKINQVVNIQQISTRLQQQLTDLCDDVYQSEKNVGQLQKEIDALMLKLQGSPKVCEHTGSRLSDGDHNISPDEVFSAKWMSLSIGASDSTLVPIPYVIVPTSTCTTDDLIDNLSQHTRMSADISHSSQPTADLIDFDLLAADLALPPHAYASIEPDTNDRTDESGVSNNRSHGKSLPPCNVSLEGPGLSKAYKKEVGETSGLKATGEKKLMGGGKESKVNDSFGFVQEMLSSNTKTAVKMPSSSSKQLPRVTRDDKSQNPVNRDDVHHHNSSQTRARATRDTGDRGSSQVAKNT